MSFQFTFDRDRAAYYQECFKNGRPIEPANGKWNVDEALALAGAARAAYGRRGPGYDVAPAEWNKLSAEAREAISTRFSHDALCMIDAINFLNGLIVQGSYDEGFDPTVKISVTMADSEDESQADGFPTICDRVVQFVSGRKG
jgi:hypothetical protein